MHVDTIIVYIYNSSSRGPLFYFFSKDKKKTTLANIYIMYTQLSAIALRKCLHRKVELSFSHISITNANK